MVLCLARWKALPSRDGGTDIVAECVSCPPSEERWTLVQRSTMLYCRRIGRADTPPPLRLAPQAFSPVSEDTNLLLCRTRYCIILCSRFLPPPRPPAPSGPIYDSILRTSEGKLFRWGVEDGDVHPFPTGVCTQIPLPCIEVCCGRKHTVALMKGGFVMSWGTGYFGQLGHGDNASYRHPRLLRRLDPQRLGERVVQVRGCGELVERLVGGVLLLCLLAVGAQG